MFHDQQYQDVFSRWLSSYHFELFASISLGIPYSPQVIEAKLRYVLKRVTRTPYHCGFYGIYTEYGTPHVHLLLASAGEPLNPDTVKSWLAQAFRRKDQPEEYKRTDYSQDKDIDLADNVERDHSPSVNIQRIYNINGVLRYLCQQNPGMHQHTGNEIFGNMNALNKRKIDSSSKPTISDLTENTAGDFQWG